MNCFFDKNKHFCVVKNSLVKYFFVFVDLILLISVHFYIHSVAAVESVRSSGKVCILDIDYQGVQNVKKSSLNPLYIFIAPPSMEALESRLRARNTESEEDVKTRLGNAAKELEYGQAEGNFDRVFVNDDLKQTSDDLIEYLLEKYPHLDYVSVDDEKEPGNRICSMLC